MALDLDATYFGKAPHFSARERYATVRIGCLTLGRFLRGKIYGPMALEREVRLKPEFAHLYPELRAGAWQSAAVTSETIAEGLVRQHGYVALRRWRVLPDVHFEFRGALPKGAQLPGQRRRLADRLG